MPRFYFSANRSHEVSGWLRQPIWLAEAACTGILLTLLRWLPLPWAFSLGRSLGGVLARFSPRLEKVRKNLRVVFPQASPEALDATTQASFRNVGVAMAELANLNRIWRQRDQRIEFRALPGATMPGPDARIVFVTAHLGAWQLTPLLGRHCGFVVPTIYAPEQNPYVDRQLARLRKAFGSPLVSRDGGIRALMRSLDRGESIGVTVDTRLDSGEPVPFFGEEAMTNTAPSRLALRYQCDLVPVIAERLPGARFRINVHPPVVPRIADATPAAQARDMSAQVNALFEEWIAARPDQWLCLKRRWPKQVYRRHA